MKGGNEKDGIVEFHMIEKDFDPKKHKIEYCVLGPEIDPWKGVCFIDGKFVWGTDHEVPRSYASEAYVLVGKKKIPLNIDGMFEVGGARIMIEGEGNSWDVVGMFSDAAETYLVMWDILEGKSQRTMITNNDSIFALFPLVTMPNYQGVTPDSLIPCVWWPWMRTPAP